MKKIILPPDIKDLEEVAKLAAKAAGAELSKRFANFKRSTVKSKSAHEILTAADLASEKLILAAIKHNFPGHRILSEEAGNNYKESDYFWVVDPLDGTTNFSMHNPLWSVSIALAYKGEVVLGLVYAPILGELFSAVAGQGARLNGRRLKVSAFKSGKLIHAYCHSSKAEDIARAVAYYRKQKLNGFDCRQMGSAAIELAYVAAGRIESIAIPGARAWDVAAGILLVREAGGRVTDFKNRHWDLEAYDMLASNGLIHRELIKAWEAI